MILNHLGILNTQYLSALWCAELAWRAHAYGRSKQRQQAWKTRSAKPPIQTALFSEPERHDQVLWAATAFTLSFVKHFSAVFIWATWRCSSGRRVRAQSWDGCCSERRAGQPAGEEQPHRVHTQQYAVCVGRLPGKKSRGVIIASLPVQVPKTWFCSSERNGGNVSSLIQMIYSVSH